MSDDDEAGSRHAAPAWKRASIDAIAPRRQQAAADAAAEANAVQAGSPEDAEATRRSACGRKLAHDEEDDGGLPEKEDNRRLAPPLGTAARDPVTGEVEPIDLCRALSAGRARGVRRGRRCDLPGPVRSGAGARRGAASRSAHVQRRGRSRKWGNRGSRRNTRGRDARWIRRRRQHHRQRWERGNRHRRELRKAGAGRRDPSREDSSNEQGRRYRATPKNRHLIRYNGVPARKGTAPGSTALALAPRPD